MARTQGLGISKNGTFVGTQSTLNFIEGSNITLTIVNDPVNAEVDVTIASTGGGGGGAFTESAGVISETDANFTADFVVGSPQLDDDGNSAHDNRMFFDKGKAAFRAGEAASTQWDNSNLGFSSAAFGVNTTASGIQSFACCGSTTASGAGSFACGTSTTASNSSSFAEGNSSNAYLRGQHSHAFGKFSTNGDAQSSSLVPRIETTDATQTELTLGGTAPSVLTRLVIPANNTWGFTVYVTGRQDSSTNCGYYRIDGLIKRDGANNTSLTGAVTVTTIAEDVAGWDVTADADDTNESLRILVTGIAATTIRWVGTVHLTEVS